MYLAHGLDDLIRGGVARKDCLERPCTGEVEKEGVGVGGHGEDMVDALIGKK